MPNGKVLLKRIPGQLKLQDIDEEETFLRQNFTQTDNRNYRDGDVASSRIYTELQGKTKEEIAADYPGSSAMYSAPTTPGVTTENGEKIYNKDKSNKKTSLITDEVRVYKGGSWKDRAYWLDPAQRRFLPQYIATDYIGFRCAMTRLGSKSKNKKTARHKRRG
jgi:gliding motility-associated lipoprotein GldJ